VLQTSLLQTSLLQRYVQVHVLVLDAIAATRRRSTGEAGQTSAEYALVLLGAASIALLVGLWAKNTDRVGKLFDVVFDDLVKKAK